MFTNMTWFSTTCCVVNWSYIVCQDLPSEPGRELQTACCWLHNDAIVSRVWGPEDRLPTICSRGKQHGELQPVTQCHAIVDLLEPCSRLTALSAQNFTRFTRYFCECPVQDNPDVQAKSFQTPK